MGGKSFPCWDKISLLPNITTGSGAHLAFYSVGTAGSALAGVGVNRPRRVADQLILVRG